MTPLEALEHVHAEQGFLVLNSRRVYEEGVVVREPAKLHMQPEPYKTVTTHVEQPMRVLGFATREEFMRQIHRLDELTGSNPMHGWDVAHPFFYKVVAPD